MAQSQILQQIITNMENVIVGKREVIELALITLLSDGHLLLEDVPGVGKTTLGKALAQSIRCSFARIRDRVPAQHAGGVGVEHAEHPGEQKRPSQLPQRRDLSALVVLRRQPCFEAFLHGPPFPIPSL